MKCYFHIGSTLTTGKGSSTPKRGSGFLILVAILAFHNCFAGVPSPTYTQSMFRRAMAKDNFYVSGMLSSNPLYVLVTIRDPRSQTERMVCILGLSLTQAIREEYGLPDTPQGYRKAFEIAVSTPNRAFEFKNRRARELVAPLYTPQQLAEVRKFLQGKSSKQLEAEARVDLLKAPNEQSSLTKIYRRQNGKRFWSSYQYRAAVAHVLLEHGVPVCEAVETSVLCVGQGKD